MVKGSKSDIFTDPDPGDPKRPDPDPQHCIKPRNSARKPPRKTFYQMTAKIKICKRRLFFILLNIYRETCTTCSYSVSSPVGTWDVVQCTQGRYITERVALGKPVLRVTADLTQKHQDRFKVYCQAGLRIRNDLFRIRIRIFFLDSGSGSD